MFRLYLYARVRFFAHCLHTRPRVQRAPGIPCSLFLSRDNVHASLGRIAPREREHIFNCHRPQRRTIQYPETAVIEPISRSVLDTPPSRGMTIVVQLRYLPPRTSGTRSRDPLARNDGGYSFAISRRIAPEVCLNLVPQNGGSRECRVHAAPAVSCAKVRKKRTRAYRYSRNTPAFPAQWLYGLCRALPGDEFVLPPSLAN